MTAFEIYGNVFKYGNFHGKEPTQWRMGTVANLHPVRKTKALKEAALVFRPKAAVVESQKYALDQAQFAKQHFCSAEQ